MCSLLRAHAVQEAVVCVRVYESVITPAMGSTDRQQTAQLVTCHRFTADKAATLAEVLGTMLTMHVQGALLGAPTPVTLLEVELAGCLDPLPGATTIEGDARLHRWLDLQAGDARWSNPGSAAAGQ